MNGNQDPDPQAERLKDPTGAQIEAWKQELEEMDLIAEDRREDGWEVLTIVAGHTNTVTRDGDEDGKYGICHIIPDNKAEEFVEFYDEETFTEYLAYGRPMNAFMYLVTEFIDPTNERSVLIASRFDTRFAEDMVEDAKEEGVLYTHVQKLNGTVLGSFEHEEYEPLIGQPTS